MRFRATYSGHIELRRDEQKVDGDAVRRNKRCRGDSDGTGSAEIIGQAHNQRRPQGMAEQDRALRIDIPAALESREQAAGAGFVSGEGEGGNVVAMTGHIGEKDPEPGDGKLLAVCKHDDAVCAEAVEYDHAPSLRPRRLQNADGSSGAGGSAREGDVTYGAVATVYPCGPPREQTQAERGENDFGAFHTASPALERVIGFRLPTVSCGRGASNWETLFRKTN